MGLPGAIQNFKKFVAKKISKPTKTFSEFLKQID